MIITGLAMLAIVGVLYFLGWNDWKNSNDPRKDLLRDEWIQIGNIVLFSCAVVFIVTCFLVLWQK